MSKYRLSINEYEKILENQGGGCLICSRNNGKMVVDHDHSCCSQSKTCGKCIRGIICDQCNRAIGLIKDSPENAYSMYKYLKGV
jgi:hypothetical protein